MARSYASKRGIVFVDPTVASDSYLVAREYTALGELCPEVRCIHLVTQRIPDVPTEAFFRHIEEAGLLIGQECYVGAVNVTWNGGMPKVFSGEIDHRPIQALLDEAATST